MALPLLKAEFRRHGVEAQAVEAVSEALSLALAQAGAGDLICIAGSLFVVGEAIEQADIRGYFSGKLERDRVIK